MSINRVKMWRLTMAFYGRQVEAGHNPVPAVSFADNTPGAYSEHEFFFVCPPSREDFLSFVNALPWAVNAWEATLMPILRNPDQQWPMIQIGRKASDVEIFDAKERKVGYLRVCHEDIMQNAHYPAILVFRTTKEILKRFKMDERDTVHATIQKHEDWIVEQSIRRAKSEDRMPQDQDLSYFTGAVLVKAGVWKNNRIGPFKLTTPQLTK